MDHEWLQDELLTGFQKLLCLCLERAPAKEILPGTVMMWMSSLTLDMAWSPQRDLRRVREAFVILGKTRRTWPAPADFLAALPSPTDQPRLGNHPQVSSSERARQAAEEIAEIFGTPLDKREDLKEDAPDGR